MEIADAHVTVCDINKAMLDVGQQRAVRFNRSSGAQTGYLDVFSFECFTGSKRIQLCFNALKVTFELQVIYVQHNNIQLPLTEN